MQRIRIRETDYVIHSVEIYPVDSTIQLLNNWLRFFFSRAVGCFGIGREAIDFTATKRRTRVKNPSFLQCAGHCKEFPKTVLKNRS